MEEQREACTPSMPIYVQVESLRCIVEKQDRRLKPLQDGDE